MRLSHKGQAWAIAFYPPVSTDVDRQSQKYKDPPISAMRASRSEQFIDVSALVCVRLSFETCTRLGRPTLTVPSPFSGCT